MYPNKLVYSIYKISSVALSPNLQSMNNTTVVNYPLFSHTHNWPYIFNSKVD